MKGMRIFRVLAVSAAAVLLAAGRPAQAGGLDKIVVVVNGYAITLLQVQEAIAPQVQLLERRIQDRAVLYARINELTTNEVEALIQRRLILDDFEKAGFQTNILVSVVNDQIKQDIKQNYDGKRSTLIKTLNAEGRSYEDYEKEQREQFIIQYMKYHNSGIRKVIISPLKIQSYYTNHQDEFKADDQVKLRMIVIPQPPDSPPGSARQIATEVLEKIESGTPFAEMASVYSAVSASDGGDKGWVERKELVPALSSAVFSLKAGQHSQVIELPDERTGDKTCYLLMAEDTRSAHIKPLSEVAGVIEQTLQDQEKTRLVDQWIKRLEAKSHIETFDF